MTTPAPLPIRPEAFPEGTQSLSAQHAGVAIQARESAKSRSRTTPAPRRYTQVLLLATLLGATFRNYWTYSHYEHLDPSVWMSFVNGTGVAPEQYRVGVKLLAWWIMQHLGGGFRHSFALLDIASSIAAGWLLYTLLERSRRYREAGPPRQWIASGAFLALFFYYLSWLPWFEKAETLPSAGLVAGLLWVWTPSPSTRDEGSGRRELFTLAGLLLLTVAQALVRADIALLLSVGMLAVAVQPRFGRGLSLPRVPAVITSAVCALLAAATQLYMMRVAYPKATYRDTPVFMLRYDFADPLVVGPFVLFLLPVAWTAYAAARKLRSLRTEPVAAFDKDQVPSLGLLLGSLLYLPLWMALGKLDEVRIFLPFALALAPLSAQLVLGRVESSSEFVASLRPDRCSDGDAR